MPILQEKLDALYCKCDQEPVAGKTVGPQREPTTVLLLNAHINLVSLKYHHRSLFLQLVPVNLETTANQLWRMSEYRVFSLRQVYHSYQGSGTLWIWDGETLRTRGWGRVPQMSSGHDKLIAYVNSLKLWWSAQDLQMIRLVTILWYMEDGPFRSHHSLWDFRHGVDSGGKTFFYNVATYMLSMFQ